jgi:hypothetical protein
MAWCPYFNFAKNGKKLAAPRHVVALSSGPASVHAQNPSALAATVPATQNALSELDRHLLIDPVGHADSIMFRLRAYLSRIQGCRTTAVDHEREQVLRTTRIIA